MSSFFSSSKGSNTTPVSGLLFAAEPLVAKTTDPFPLFEADPNGLLLRGLLLTPFGHKRENAGAALRNMVAGLERESYIEREGKKCGG